MDHPLRHTTSTPSSPEMDPSSAFELCFELEYERVFGAVYLVTGSRRDAEALAQGAFQRTWERWDHVGTMDRPSSFPLRWALSPFRRAIHRSRMRLGRRHRDPDLEPFEDVRLDESLRDLVAGLPRSQRAALALVRGLDLTPGEAGRALGRRAATVRLDVSAGEAAVEGWIQEEPSRHTTSAGDADPVTDVIDAVRRSAYPDPGAFDRHLVTRMKRGRRRRITTVALVAAVGALIAFTAGRGSGTGAPEGEGGSVPPLTDAAPARSRLPGMLMRASAVIPDGWRVGDSIWGADGPGVTALSTGRRGATVSVAVFDLILLSPFDPATNRIHALTANGRERWFAEFRRSFDRQTRRRLVDTGDTDPLRFSPWDPLAWVLSRAPSRGAIHISQPRIDGREGSLVSFVHTDATTGLFSVFRNGTIKLQPDVTYTFWAPASGESLSGDVLIGIAREPGARPGAPEQAVIDSLRLRGY